MTAIKNISSGFWGAIGSAIAVGLLAVLGYYIKPVRSMLVAWWTTPIELGLGVLTIVFLLLLALVLFSYFYFRGSARDAWDRASMSELEYDERRSVELKERMGAANKAIRIKSFKDRTKP